MAVRKAEDLKEIITQLVKKLGFSADVEVKTDIENPETLLCSVRVEEDQNFLIGQYGINLAAVQHIARVIFRKKNDEQINIVVDVNDYLSGKKSLLEKEAKKAAIEALQNNISVALRPMLPYERKIVHAYLANNQEIVTESVGKGEERKVMVSPRPSTENKEA